MDEFELLKREEEQINSYAQVTLTNFISWLIFFLGITLTAIGIVLSFPSQPAGSNFGVFLSPKSSRIIAGIFILQTIFALLATFFVGKYFSDSQERLGEIKSQLRKLIDVEPPSYKKKTIALDMYVRLFPVIFCAILVYLFFWVYLFGWG